MKQGANWFQFLTISATISFISIQLFALRFKIEANINYSKALNMKSSISLIGMAGAGKSSVGERLAHVLGFDYVDSDHEIEKNNNQSLQRILDESGYLKLRQMEEDAILSIAFNQTVLSTGGSAVYSNAAMKHLNENSLVVFLDVPFELISERVPDFLDRGFAKHPDQSIKEAFDERATLYNQHSQVSIQNDGDLDSCVASIVNLT